MVGCRVQLPPPVWLVPQWEQRLSASVSTRCAPAAAGSTGACAAGSVGKAAVAGAATCRSPAAAAALPPPTPGPVPLAGTGRAMRRQVGLRLKRAGCAPGLAGVQAGGSLPLMALVRRASAACCQRPVAVPDGCGSTPPRAGAGLQPPIEKEEGRWAVSSGRGAQEAFGLEVHSARAHAPVRKSHTAVAVLAGRLLEYGVGVAGQRPAAALHSSMVLMPALQPHPPRLATLAL